MGVPDFSCETLDDFEPVMTELQEQLLHGLPFPAASIHGPLLDVLIAEATANDGEHVAVVAQFDEQALGTNVPTLIKASEMLLAVSLCGEFGNIFNPEADAQAAVINTKSAGRHTDNGSSNIINFTLQGSRTTIVEDEKFRTVSEHTLVPGVISVIPAKVVEGGFTVVPWHRVEALTPGLSLNTRHFNRRANSQVMNGMA